MLTAMILYLVMADGQTQVVNSTSTQILLAEHKVSYVERGTRWMCSFKGSVGFHPIQMSVYNCYRSG